MLCSCPWCSKVATSQSATGAPTCDDHSIDAIRAGLARETSSVPTCADCGVALVALDGGGYKRACNCDDADHFEPRIDNGRERFGSD